MIRGFREPITLGHGSLTYSDRLSVEENKESAMGTSAEAKSVQPAGVEDVRAVPLGRLAQEDRGTETLCRVLPGYDGKQVAVAAFQSSI